MSYKKSQRAVKNRRREQRERTTAKSGGEPLSELICSGAGGSRRRGLRGEKKSG